MTNPDNPGINGLMFSRLTRTVAMISAAASLGVMAYAGDFSSPVLLAVAAGFAAWVCAPYAFAWFAAGKLQNDQVASGLLALGLLAIAGLGLYGYYITFINNPAPDAQDGLVLVVIPLYQLGAILLVWVIASFVKRLRGL